MESLLQFAHQNTDKLGIGGFNEEKLREVLVAYTIAMHDAPPATTLNQEASNWKWWLRYCEAMNWPPVLSNMAAASGVDQDAFALYQAFVSGALPWIYERMPSAKGRSDPPKPTSALAVLTGVRRVHLKRFNLPHFVPLTTAVQACDGLIRKYMEEHGPEALQPQRKEPLTKQMILKLLGDHLKGAFVGTRGDHAKMRVDWGVTPWAGWRALVATMAQTGFRKADVSLESKVKFGLQHLTAASLVWCIGGVLYKSPSREQLRSLKEGDYALLRPPPSKADQFGLHWGACTIYLRFHPTELINAARELAAYEILRNLPAKLRRTAPLFVNFGNGPWRHHQLDALFKDVLATFVPEDEIKRYSMHSFRIYLACALRAAGASNGVIQAILRWRSDDALKIYARMNDAHYADWLSKAALADVSSVTTGTMRHAKEGPGIIAGSEVQAFQGGWLQRASDIPPAAFSRVNLGNLPEISSDQRIAAIRGASAQLLAMAQEDQFEI